MINEEHYNELLKYSLAKQRLHDLFQRFIPRIQKLIVHKYSGIFNYYSEVSDEQVNKLCDHLEACLWEIEEEAIYNAYKDII